MTVNLSSLDLNLLVLLDALLEEKNVTRAGARVGLSQPAASNALKRLRLLLADPLLEKDGRRLRLTERGHQYKAPLREALDRLRSLLADPAPFEPATSAFKVRLFASDHVVLVLMPALHERLSRLAPLAEVIVRWSHTELASDLLEADAIDIAIGRYHNTPNDICRAKLYDETLVVQARRGHPVFEGELTPQAFAGWPRIATSFDGRLFGDQEQAMARAGIDVRSSLVLPHLVAAPMLTLDSDLVTIAPQRMAKRLAALLELDWRPLPFAAPAVPMEMMWHEKTAADPALAWFRRLVIDVGAQI
jgi:DNA-binding transcriptional LysR family regulator